MAHQPAINAHPTSLDIPKVCPEAGAKESGQDPRGGQAWLGGVKTLGFFDGSYDFVICSYNGFLR